MIAAECEKIVQEGHSCAITLVQPRRSHEGAFRDVSFEETSPKCTEMTMFNQQNSIFLIIAALGLMLVGCGDPNACDPTNTNACADGNVCEAVAGTDQFQCFSPISVEGQVFDLVSTAAIEGARVVAMDVSGSPISDVAVTDADGAYSLVVPSSRDENGVPQDSVTLRVEASQYEPFPKPPRNPLPVDLNTGVEGDTGWVVNNPVTDVGLLPYQGSTALADLGTVEGTIGSDAAGGALVIAVVGGVAVASTIADADGNFVLFNVPPGASLTIEAYIQGLAIESKSVSVAAGEAVMGVSMAASTSGVGTVSGKVEIVATNTLPSGVSAGDVQTSVILVVESTFQADLDMVFVRGEMPSGLYDDTITGNDTNWAIEGVPPGTYRVLAAYPNDHLVRDPDLSIAGTEVLKITVSGDLALADSFKITSALPVISPGAEGLEAVGSLTPDLVFSTAPSAAGYEVRVYDTYGAEIHRVYIDDMNPGATGSTISTSAKTVTYPYPGTPALASGLVYQFRAMAFDGSITDPNTATVSDYISATEDLKGSFITP